MYVPKDNAVLKGLNSYYVNLDKLLEFYKASMFSGCLHFKSHEVEAAVFLSNELIQRVIFEENGVQLLDEDALRAIVDKTASSNFLIDIYELSEEIMKFCCSIPDAKTLHSNISTEFVDINKLLRKLLADKITGFLEIVLDAGSDKKYMFFKSGVIVGSSDSADEPEYTDVDRVVSRLVRELEATKGVLNIKALPLNGAANGEKASPATITVAPKASSASVLTTVRHILAESNEIFTKAAGNREKFDIILKRKFLQKAEKYSFLDPFEEEVVYDGKELSVESSVDTQRLLDAIKECLTEIGAEYGLADEFQSRLRTIMNS